MSSLATAAVSGATKAVASALVRHFWDEFAKPLLARNRVQQAINLALKRYLKRLDTSTKFVPTIAIQGSSFLLDQVYEPLTLANHHNFRATTIDCFPKQIVRPSSRTLVVDSAGMGKSTLSKYLVRQALDAKAFFPVMIELRRVKPGESLRGFICSELMGGAVSDGCAESLNRAFIGGGFLFVFDGYDEIDDDARGAISSEISAIANDYQLCAFWLTSRPDGGLSSFAGFTQLSIKPLEQEQAFSLLRRYDAKRGKAAGLIAKLEKAPQVAEFLGNPLLLTLLYKAYDYKAVIPLKRNVFFRQVFDALYQDHDLSKEGAFERRKKSELDIEDFHRFLRALGVVTYQAGRVQYTVEAFNRHLTKAAQVIGMKCDCAAVRRDLLSAVPVFTRDGTDVRWSHKAFQDYFAAQFILLDLANEDRAKFMQRLVERDNPEKAVNVLGLVAEADRPLFRSVNLTWRFEELAKNFRSTGVTATELNFATFFLATVGGFYWIPSDRVEEQVGAEYKKFSKFAERVGHRRSMLKGSGLSFRGGLVLCIHSDEWDRYRALARIDRDAFSPAPLLEDSQVDLEAESANMPVGPHGYTDLVKLGSDGATQKQRIIAVRLMFEAYRAGIPSLLSVGRVRDDTSIEERADLLEQILFRTQKSE